MQFDCKYNYLYLLSVSNLTAGRPITKVVDWPNIVVKYLEVTGTDIKMELPEESHPGD